MSIRQLFTPRNLVQESGRHQGSMHPTIYRHMPIAAFDCPVRSLVRKTMPKIGVETLPGTDGHS